MGNEALLASIIPKMHFSIQLNKILPERKEVAGGGWGGGYKETQYSKAFHDCPGYDLQFAASRKGNNASQEGGYSQDIKIPSRRPRSSVSIDPKALCVAELEIQRLFS